MTTDDVIDHIELLRTINTEATRQLKQAKEENERMQREMRELRLSVQHDHEYLMKLKGLRGTHILRRQDGFEKVLTLQLGFPPVLRHLPPQPPSFSMSDVDKPIQPLEFTFSRFLHVEGKKVALYLEV